MNTRFALLVIAASIIDAASVHAAQSEKSPPPQSAQMQHGRMAGMENKQMGQMQERMRQMQEQMDRIHRTNDPNERRKLMQEHMQSMDET